MYIRNRMVAHFPGTPACDETYFRQAVSKHLRVLTECGLVEPEQQGREIRYHLKEGKMYEIE